MKRKSKSTQKYIEYKAELNGGNTSGESKVQNPPNMSSFTNFPQLRSRIVRSTTEDGETRLASNSGVRILHNTSAGRGRGRGKGRGEGVFSPAVNRGRHGIRRSSPVKPGLCQASSDLPTNVVNVMNTYLESLASAVEVDLSLETVVLPTNENNLNNEIQ